MDDVVVRLATLDDAGGDPSHLQLRGRATTTHTFDLVPRTLEDQKAWLQERAGAHGVLVAELDGQVVGFSSLSEYRPRAAYRTSVESSVYVNEAVRGRGVGRRLMRELIGLAQARGFHTMIARVAGGHEASGPTARGRRVHRRGHRAGSRPQVRRLARRSSNAADARGGRDSAASNDAAQ